MRSWSHLPPRPSELVARFRDKPLDFEPGEKWSYSNSGYVLLGYLIEKISGESYEKFVQENIFTPLGMKDSGYDSNSAIIPQRASGYASGKNGFENAGFVHMSIPLGAGALYSTTEDLLKWEQGLFGGKVLQPASLEKMTTPFKNDYAFGLQRADGRRAQGDRTRRRHRRLQHGAGVLSRRQAHGGGAGKCESGRRPEKSPGNWPRWPTAKTVKLPSERKEITLDPKVLSRYVGAYQMPGGPVMLITLEGNQLFRQVRQPAGGSRSFRNRRPCSS